MTVMRKAEDLLGMDVIHTASGDMQKIKDLHIAKYILKHADCYERIVKITKMPLKEEDKNYERKD